MVQRTSPRRSRLQRELGENLRRWRRINGMSATQLAERAAVTRETLRHLENGTGAVRLDSLLAVLGSLGILDTVVQSTDPFRSNAARARMDDILQAGGRI